MRKTLARALPVLILAVMAVTSVAASAKPGRLLLTNGDRMVFLGDSITEQRLYTRYVMNFFTMCAPGAKISFRNAGWGGDRSPGGLSRLGRDVLSLKPTVVSICFGMNDANYTTFDQKAFDTYMDGMRGLVSELKKAGVRVVLLTPGCVDTDASPSLKSYNATLGQFGQGVLDLAKKEKLPSFNLHALMLNVQTEAKKDNPRFCMIPDGVHPDQAGHAVMAYALLRTLAPEGVVCGARINATKRAVYAVNCSISDLVVTPATVSFTRADRVLPTYLDPEAAIATNYIPFYQNLSPYRLAVAGLKSGTWRLVVDGTVLGSFTSQSLAEGVELANLPGPWLKIGQVVNTLSTDQESMYYHRWREVSMADVPTGEEDELHPSGGEAKLEEMLKKLDAEIDAKEAARIEKAAGVHTWKWSLTLIQ